ncbi:MAG: glycosyltransferase [Thermodesulfobacteriota bacterium]
MTSILDDYAAVAGEDVIHHLQQLTKNLRGRRVVHVNSTREGGGVAEILNKMVPLMEALGIETHWEIITGEEEFYQCTKSFHNALQGNPIDIPGHLLEKFEETNRARAEELRPLLEDADIVLIHDPQPAPLLRYTPNRKGKWIWRCHIDLSHPYRPVWKYLREFVEGYDASIFSLSDFAQTLQHPLYLIPPSIDPLSEKNVDLSVDEVQRVCEEFGLDTGRPLVTQISRFDRFKDPIGVITAFRLARRFKPDLQLVLAGGGASDDPEGAAVLEEVKTAAENDPNIHILMLPADAHRIINALQRASDVVIQKSVKEGFGLTVTEGLWKGKPVIGGNTGGIRLQVVNHHTGFLVNSPEGAALRLRYLLENPDKMTDMGRKAREFVRENFLLTRQLRGYLTAMVALIHGLGERIVTA